MGAEDLKRQSRERLLEGLMGILAKGNRTDIPREHVDTILQVLEAWGDVAHENAVRSASVRKEG